MVFKIKTICCICIFVLGMNATAANSTQPGAQAAPKASAMKNTEKVLGGVVSAVNPEKKEFSVLRNNVAYPVLVSGATQILSGKDPIDFSNIAVGDAVTVNYTKNADGSRNAVTVEKKSSAQPAASPAKHKIHVKAEPKNTEASAAPVAPAVPKAEVKAEPKKAEVTAVAAPKAEVKAAPKKPEAPVAPAVPKAEVKAEPKKAETPVVAPVAPKAEVKAEPKKAEAPAAAPVAPKPEVKKAETPAVAPAAPKAEVKVEPKKAETPATK
jgi:hypothetical protein